VLLGIWCLVRVRCSSVASMWWNWVGLGPGVVARLTSSSGSWDSDGGARVLDGVSLVAPSIHCVLVWWIQCSMPARNGNA
jgi:hypothetical protein